MKTIDVRAIMREGAGFLGGLAAAVVVLVLFYFAVQAVVDGLAGMAR